MPDFANDLKELFELTMLDRLEAYWVLPDLKSIERSFPGIRHEECDASKRLSGLSPLLSTIVAGSVRRQFALAAGCHGHE
jgi:hypothetical protein